MARPPGALPAAAAILVFLSAALPARASDALEGYWWTDRRDGIAGLVEIVPCGPAFCGTVLRGVGPNGEPVMDQAGARVVQAMQPQGDGHYEGRVLDPRNGRVYLGRIELQGHRMVLSGCVLGGLICANSIWTRADAD